MEKIKNKQQACKKEESVEEGNKDRKVKCLL
jgi:hypothetical protein